MHVTSTQPHTPYLHLGSKVEHSGKTVASTVVQINLYEQVVKQASIL